MATTRERTIPWPARSDALAAAAAALAALVALATGPMSDPDAAPRGADVPGVTLTIVLCAALAWHRTAPRVAVAIAGAAALGLSLGGWGLTIGALLTWLLTGLVAARTDRRTAIQLVALGTLGSVASVFAFSTDNRDVLDLLLAAGVGALPPLVGDAMRRQRELTDEVRRLRDADLRHAVDAERLRIARDVHDTVGHHLSAIALQARAGELEHPDRALRRIAGLADRALLDTRRTLGLLRDGSGDGGSAGLAPPASLASLPDLLDSAAAAGLAVEVRGERFVADLPDLVSTCAFRVVQEGLTNSVRHGGARRAVLEIERDGGRLALTLEDDGPPLAGPVRDGHGLTGMRERVAALGGMLEAVPRPGGGFRVHAVLPDRP